MRTARAAPLCLTGRGTHGLLQLHRRLLQSHPAALRPGVSLAHLLRTGDANRPTARYPLNRPRKRGNFRGERALPLAWRVAETEGAIGFATQQELLEVVAGWLSVGQAVNPACLPFLRNPRDDLLVLRSRMGLSAAAQGQPCRPPGGNTDHDWRTRLVRRPLFREHPPYRQADHHQPRHHPRSWAYRALDYRHVGQAGISHHPGIRRALGHRAHVFGFQIARVWSPTDPSALSRPPRPPDI